MRERILRWLDRWWIVPNPYEMPLEYKDIYAVKGPGGETYYITDDDEKMPWERDTKTTGKLVSGYAYLYEKKPMRDPVAEAVKARIERAKEGKPL